MNIKDCENDLRVRFHESSKEVVGTVVRIKEDERKAIVKPEDGSALVEVPIRNLHHAPPFKGVKITLPRYMVEKLLMENDTVTLVIDASGSYEKGFTNPMTITAMDTRNVEVPVTKGLYVNASDGTLTLSKPNMG